MVDTINFLPAWFLFRLVLFSGMAILCAIGVPINLYFLYHAIPAVRKKALPSHRYLLSINLSIVDIVMQLASGGIATAFSFTGMIPDLPTTSIMAAFFIVPGGFSLLILSVYLALNTFQLIAVKYPIFYKTRLTARHCHLINAFSWILGASLLHFCMFQLVLWSGFSASL